ncbi:MAG: gamma-glutamyl-gamma-aminobutyrate hydrolase family protein [Burkholderiaceae bacterium]|jgi:putative glutamine amidotransferase|nr:gamma-glutamyl-gamma-aminobutyrate hydrolase family protein [Burkholderiaceae bacterium]
MTLRIGISARLLDQPPPGGDSSPKRLQYLESHMAQWIMSHGVVALMIPFIDAQAPLPRVRPRGRSTLADLVEQLDGLVLQGGSDIDPRRYGAQPWRADANLECDPVRDAYELDLLRGFIDAEKPVLGICRGAQLINVHFGGTLVQDIPSQWPGALTHFNLERYHHLTHDVRPEPGSLLERIYGGAARRVVSIHHQCVQQLGTGLMIEARSPDGVPEAIRHSDHSFIVGVQWHPEFHGTTDDTSLAPSAGVLDSGPLMMAFLKACARRLPRAERHARVSAMRHLPWPHPVDRAHVA